MKVLPMHQPWASLVVKGLKRVETRPKPAPFSMKGRVAVHANRTPDFLRLMAELPFSRYLRPDADLPLGFIIGTVEITRSVTINEQTASWQERHRPEEFAFGDYTPGRFAWLLRKPILLKEPIPFRAHQGWPTIEDHLIPEHAR